LIVYCIFFLYFFNNLKEYLFACAPQTTRGHSVKLGADPKGKNFLYTNGRTVIIRDIEVRQLNEY